MLKEVNRSEVYSNLLGWISKVLAAKTHAHDVPRPSPHNAGRTNPKVTGQNQSSTEN
jgi:hypothetical protein